MIDALLGALIAVTATTALLSAIQLSELAFERVGGANLIDGYGSVADDFQVLSDAGYDASPGSQDQQKLEADLKKLSSQFMQ